MDKIQRGFTASCFDLFHAGHVLMLRDAKKYCDYLIVALQSDPTLDRADSKNKPIQDLYERYVQVAGCRYVNEVMVYSTEADMLNLLKTQHVNVRFLGEDYVGKDFTGKDFCLHNNIELIYLPRQHNYSTSELRNRIINQPQG